MKKTKAAIFFTAVFLWVSAVSGFAAIPKIDVDVESNVVEIGQREVEIPGFTLSERKAGAFEKGKTIYLQIEGITLEDGILCEVTEGDIQVSKVDVDGDVMAVTIRKESTEASTLRFSNIKLFLDSSLPAGSYPLYLVTKEDSRFQDNLMGEDYDPDGEDGFTTEYLTLLSDFVIVTGPSTTGNQGIVQLSATVGEQAIRINGKEVYGGAAPYISSQGRIMLPVRAIVEGMGDNALVFWNEEAKLVTLQMGSTIVSMRLGDTYYTKNGVQMPMEGQMEITNGRAFLPMRDLGHALGISDEHIAWNGETQTATFYGG